MKLDRFRSPVLAAGAVLMISGAGIAFAGSPPASAPAQAAVVVQAEPVGPATDTVQQGDQTTPDVGAPAANAPAAVNSTILVVPPATATATAAPTATPPAGLPDPGTTADPAGETATETPGATDTPEAAEAPGAAEAAGGASDEPGGHEDPAGQIVDHQFDGVE